MYNPKRVGSILKKTAGIAIKKPYYRSTGIIYINSLISSIGSLSGGRYNPKNSFEVLYISPDPATAIEECKKTGNFKIPPRIIITIEVNLQSVLDLEDPDIIKNFGIEEKKLLSPWRVPSYKESYTQTFGRLVYESKRFEGISYPSAKVDNKYNLAVFPDRLKKDSEIIIYDPDKTVESVIFKL